jgi:hypothetical protein
MGQDGSKRDRKRYQSAADKAKMRQNGSKRGQQLRQIGPTWLKIGPKWAQGDPRSAQNDTKRGPKGYKNDQGTKNIQKGTPKNRDERTFRAEGGAKSEKHYNPRFIFVPPMGPESRSWEPECSRRADRREGRRRRGGRGGSSEQILHRFGTGILHAGPL